MRLGRGLCIGALCAVLATPATGLADTRRVPEGFFGVNGQVFNAEWGSTGYDDRAARRAAAMAALGVETVRVDVTWPSVERTRGNFDWTKPDRIIGTLARHGITVRPIADFTPEWAREPLCSIQYRSERCRPASAADYAEYTRRLVERYGRNGTFWTDPPPGYEDIPDHPIESVEIWNEENADKFFLPQANPEFYGQMYRQARAAMRQEDPQIVTIVGGLAKDYPPMLQLEEFLNRMGAPETIDAIAVHSYDTTGAGTWDQVVRARDWMDAHGLADRPIYFNEWGWPTKDWPAGNTFTGTQFTDAERGGLFDEVSSTLARSDCGLAQVAPHTWETSYVASGTSAEPWYGIARVDELSLTATRYGDLIRRLRGDAGADPAPRATVHLCDRTAPDGDGDGVEDQHDFAPLDPAVSASPVASAPSSHDRPAVYGEFRSGATLRATPGTWDGSPLPTFAVERWEMCDADESDCSPVPGATGWELTLGEPPLGHVYRVVVRAANDHGSATAISLESAPQPRTPPVIYGQARINYTIYAAAGEWRAIPAARYLYTFYSCGSGSCSVVKGPSTNTSYKIQTGDLGKRLFVEVTAINAFGTTRQSSAWTAAVGL